MNPRFSYWVGEMVRIKVGAFQCFTGRVKEVDENNATLKVMVEIFGRQEPIQLGFLEVEKITFTEEE
jgi:transcriptional antiterminator NusG